MVGQAQSRLCSINCIMASLLKAHFELFLSTLSERLDLAKARGLLHFSLSIRRACKLDPVYLDFIRRGWALLEHKLCDSEVVAGMTANSKVLGAVARAAILDSANLAAVFTLLRVEELLEECFEEPSVATSAACVVAILGTYKFSSSRGVSLSLTSGDQGPRLLTEAGLPSCFRVSVRQPSDKAHVWISRVATRVSSGTRRHQGEWLFLLPSGLPHRRRWA